MLQTIRKYRRSVLGVVGVGLTAMAMGGFGVNFASKSHGNYAIRVGDREISYDEFAQTRRGIDQRYRQMFGDNYSQLIKVANLNIGQEAVDSSIRNALLDKIGNELGLKASPQSIKQMIHNELFAGQFDPARYESFLTSQGLTGPQFESELAKDIVRQQVVTLWTDASRASKRETKEMLERDKTAYSIQYIKVGSEDVKKDLADPSAEQIEKYYTDNLTDFQTPIVVSYHYSVLEPSDVLNKVTVNEDDIEFEYTENPTAYQNPAEVRLSQIFLKFAEKGGEEQKEKQRKLAQDIQKKIKDGEKFEDLAKAYSQEPASAMKGGDSGWQQAAQLPKDVASKAFSAEIGVVSDNLENEKGIFIVRVEDKKDPQLKELAAVRSEIEAKIRAREAPAVLSLQAQDLYDAWTKSGKPLAQFAKENGLKEPKAATKLSKEQNPEPELKDLTANVVASADAKQQLTESGEKQIFIEVDEFIDESVQPLDQARAKVVDVLKSRAAIDAARAKADKILESIKKGEVANLKEASQKFGSKLEEMLELTPTTTKGIAAEASIRDSIFSATSAPLKPQEVMISGNDFVLVEVTEIKKPSEDLVRAGIDEMQKGLSRDLADFGLEAMLSKMKAETTVDVQPGILAE